MKVGDLVRHARLKHLIGIIIQSSPFGHRHKVKWLEEGAIVADLGWNKPRMFSKTMLIVILEAK